MCQKLPSSHTAAFSRPNLDRTIFKQAPVPIISKVTTPYIPLDKPRQVLRVGIWNFLWEIPNTKFGGIDTYAVVYP